MMTPRWLLILSILPGSHGWMASSLVWARVPWSPSQSFTYRSSIVATTPLSVTPIDVEDQSDDGWESSSSSLEAKTAELRRLQNERSASSSSNQSSAQRQAPEAERDLFIPVFSLVSLVGLFGSYGYEMLRLYSRGELYLPWDN